mmetsp:Transcript_2558/g.5564  ORF Transcript_2558/g.5564 Transcript_2558/m.5564 type:complete len:229 (-) Transcript_2558:110-796(-)
MFSSLLKTESTVISFSKRPLAKSTLAAISPPLIWISMMWAFFNRRLSFLTWVWEMTRTTDANFLMRSSSASMSLPPSSVYFLEYLVKAFFLARYQFLYMRRLNSSFKCSAKTVVRVRRPWGVSTYPTTPTTTMGGVSTTVTASTTSRLCMRAPGRSTPRTTWVIPALYPRNAVKWGASLASSWGKDRTLPECFLVRFLGKKPKLPFRGASNFLCDIVEGGLVGKVEGV